MIGEKLECEEISAVIEIQGDIEDVVLGLKNIPDVASVEIRALLQLVLAAHRDNRMVRCEKGGGPAVKMLKLMGVL